MSDFWGRIEKKWRSEDFGERSEDGFNLNGGTKMLVVEDQEEQPLMRGITGSRKNLILMKKAKAKAMKNVNETIMIFTYGRPLENANKVLMNKFNLANLDVSTFCSWAAGLYKQVFGESHILITDIDQLKLIKHSIESLKETHQFTINMERIDLLLEEFALIKRMGIQTMSEYTKMIRKWKGTETLVAYEYKQAIFEIFVNYENSKVLNKLYDYDDLAYRLLECKNYITSDMKFDHIFVHDSEDLQVSEILLLKECARKTIMISGDKSQKIYNTTFSWNALGLDVHEKRMKIINKPYQSTRQIIELAVSLRENDGISQAEEDYVRPMFPNRQGMKPVLRKFETRQMQDEAVIEIIEIILENAPEATIGVLCRDSIRRDAALFRLGDALKRKGIDFMNIHGEEEVNPFTPGVKFSTFHTAKGLEFHFVLIVDLNDSLLSLSEDEANDYWNRERRLLYIAITRARNALYMFAHGNENRLLREIDSTLYDVK